jgi:L-alanine-DL-glutamate epimerase-like enolase superfamily enzyme
MRITDITAYQLDLPLAAPYRLSGGRLLFERLDSTIVRVDTDEGVHGWGEVCPWGASYLPMHGRGVRAAMDELAPALLGLDPRRLDLLDRVMATTLPGHLYARAAIDAACWDILGRVAGLPVVELLGGRDVERVPVASSVPTATPEAMLAGVRAYRARGYRVHSVKIGSGVAEDVARIEALAADAQPDETIFYDVNRAWLPHVAITVMNAVRHLPVWFEQPCETLEECAVVRSATSQPISLDEAITTPQDLLRARDLRAGEIVNIKVGRVGGLSRARRLRDLALELGLGVLVEDTGGTILADTAAAHLASTVPARSLIGTWSCQELITVEVAPGQGARVNDGTMCAPELPGLGVEVDPDALGAPAARYSARAASGRAARAT